MSVWLVTVPALLSIALAWVLLRQARWFTYLAAVLLLFAANFGLSCALVAGNYCMGVVLLHCVAYLISTEIEFPPSKHEIVG